MEEDWKKDVVSDVIDGTRSLQIRVEDDVVDGVLGSVLSSKEALKVNDDVVDDASGITLVDWAQTPLPSKESLNLDVTIAKEKRMIELLNKPGIGGKMRKNKSKVMYIKPRDTNMKHYPYWSVQRFLEIGAMSEICSGCKRFYQVFMRTLGMMMDGTDSFVSYQEIYQTHMRTVRRLSVGVWCKPCFCALVTMIRIDPPFCVKMPRLGEKINLFQNTELRFGLNQTIKIRHPEASLIIPADQYFDNPDFSPALFVLCWCFVKHGNFEDALDEMRKNMCCLTPPPVKWENLPYDIGRKLFEICESVDLSVVLTLIVPRILDVTYQSFPALYKTMRMKVSLRQAAYMYGVCAFLAKCGRWIKKPRSIYNKDYKLVVKSHLLKPYYKVINNVFAVYRKINKDFELGLSAKPYIPIESLYEGASAFWEIEQPDLCEHGRHLMTPCKYFEPFAYGHDQIDQLCYIHGAESSSYASLVSRCMANFCHICNDNQPTSDETEVKPEPEDEEQSFWQKYFLNPFGLRTPVEDPAEETLYPEEGGVVRDGHWMESCFSSLLQAIKKFITVEFGSFMSSFIGWTEGLWEKIKMPFRAIAETINDMSKPFVTMLKSMLKLLGLDVYCHDRDLRVDLYVVLLTALVYTSVDNPIFKIICFVFLIHHFKVVSNVSKFVKYFRDHFFNVKVEMGSESDDDTPTSNYFDFISILSSSPSKEILVKGVMAVICFTSAVASVSQSYRAGLATIIINMAKNLHFLGAGMSGFMKMWTSISEGIPKLFAKIRELFSCQNEEDKARQKKEKDREVFSQTLVKFVCFMKALDNDSGYNLIRRSAKVQKLIEAFYPFYVRIPVVLTEVDIKEIMGHQFFVDVRQAQNSFIKVYDIVNRVNRHGRFRKTPFHIQFVGDPGVGKSTILSSLVDELHARYFPHVADNSVVYARSKTDHYDGYHGQPIMIHDDIWAANDYKEVQELLPIISCAPVVLPMAHLSDKATFFESQFILTTTNVPFPDTTAIWCNEAVWRRRHIFARVKCDSSVRDPSTAKFDLALFNKQFPDYDDDRRMKELPHLTFDILQPIPGKKVRETVAYSENDKTPDGLFKPLENLKYHEFLDRVHSRYLAMRNEEEGMKTTDLVKLEKEQVDTLLRASMTGRTALTEMYLADCQIADTLLSDVDDLLNEIPVDKYEEGESDEPGFKIFDDEATSDMADLEAHWRKQSMDEDKFDKLSAEDKIMFAYVVTEHRVLTLERLANVMALPEYAKIPLARKMVISARMAALQGEHIDIERRSRILAGRNRRYGSDLPESINPVEEEMYATLVGECDHQEAGWRSREYLEQKHRKYFYGRAATQMDGDCLNVRVLPNYIKDPFSILLKDILGTPKFMKSAFDCGVFHPTRFKKNHFKFKSPAEDDVKHYIEDNFELIKKIKIDFVRKLKWTSFEQTTSDGPIQHQDWAMRVEPNEFVKWEKAEKSIKDLWYNLKERSMWDRKKFEMAEQTSLYKNMERPHIDIPYRFSEDFIEQCDYFCVLPKKVKAYLVYTVENSNLAMACTFNAKFSEYFAYYTVQYNKLIHRYVQPRMAGLGDFLVTLIVCYYAFFILYAIRQMFKAIFGIKEEKPTSKVLFKRALPAYMQPHNVPTSDNRVLEIANKLRKNMTPVMIEGAKANAIGVKGQNLMLNLHTVRLQIERGSPFILHWKPTDAEEWWEIEVDPKTDVRIVPNSDACIIHSKQLRFFADITHLFVTEKDLETYEVPDELVQIYYSNNTFHLNQYQCDGLQVNYLVNFLPTAINRVMTYRSPRQVGTSGGIVYHINNYTQRPVYGIQSFASKYLSNAVVITKEILDQYLVQGFEHQGPLILDSEELTPTSELITSHILPVGSIAPNKVQGMVRKSKLNPTILANEFPSLSIPAVLSGFDPRVEVGTHPLQHSVNKFGRGCVKSMPLRILSRAIDDVANFLGSKTKPSYLIPLTIKESITGLPREGFAPLKLSTSPGLPWVYHKQKPGKRTWVEINELGEIEYLSPEFLANVDNVEASLEKGVIPPNSMYEFPKDELRPIEKVLGPPMKTRSISVMDFTYSILYRKYMLGLEASLHTCADGTFPLCVGIDPTSASWTRMYKSLRIQSSLGNDFDIGNWDGYFPPWLYMACAEIACKIYGYEGKARNVVFCLLLNACFGYTNFLDLVLQKFRGVPSGFAGTTIVNTKGHFVLFYCFYLLLCERLGLVASFRVFMTYISVFLYGDDVVFTIHEILQSQGITPEAFVDLYREFGWTISSASKSSDPKIQKPVENLQFLKRSFLEDPLFGKSVIYGAIDKEVINSLLHWMRDTHNRSQQLYLNIHDALEFSYPYGEDYYQNILDRINLVLDKHRRPRMILSYQEMRTTILERFYN